MCPTLPAPRKGWIAQDDIKERRKTRSLMTLTLKNLNHWIPKQHFKMETLQTVLSLIRPDCYMASMGFAVRVRSAGQKIRATCHQRDRADVTEFVTLVLLSSLGQHVGVLALAGYKRRKSALTADPIDLQQALLLCAYLTRTQEVSAVCLQGTTVFSSMHSLMV